VGPPVVLGTSCCLQPPVVLSKGENHAKRQNRKTQQLARAARKRKTTINVPV